MRITIVAAILWGCTPTVISAHQAKSITLVSDVSGDVKTDSTFRDLPCGRQIDETSFSRKADSFLELDNDAHVVLLPQTPSEKLIVMLPGVGGNTQHVDGVLQAFASAGFRSMALTWNHMLDEEMSVVSRGKARDECLASSVTNEELNDCLVRVRAEKNEDPVWGVFPRLTALISNLDASYPSEGWGAFLIYDMDGNPQPNWEQIVIAGYSEGANQSAFITRAVPVAGAIFISGGGDLGTIVYEAPGVLADWMYVAPFNDPLRTFSLNHVDEQYDLNEGWTLDGVPEAWADTASRPLDWAGAHRFVDTSDVDGDPDLAHASTVLAGELTPVHMFMACGAND